MHAFLRNHRHHLVMDAGGVTLGEMSQSIRSTRLVIRGLNIILKYANALVHLRDSGSFVRRRRSGAHAHSLIIAVSASSSTGICTHALIRLAENRHANVLDFFLLALEFVLLGMLALIEPLLRDFDGFFHFFALILAEFVLEFLIVNRRSYAVDVVLDVYVQKKRSK